MSPQLGGFNSHPPLFRAILSFVEIIFHLVLVFFTKEKGRIAAERTIVGDIALRLGVQIPPPAPL